MINTESGTGFNSGKGSKPILFDPLADTGHVVLIEESHSIGLQGVVQINGDITIRFTACSIHNNR